MSTDTLPSSELRSHVSDALDVTPFEGRTSAYVETGANLNLNSIAIGLGLEGIEYEPDRFSGVVYQPDETETTLVLFADGTIAAIDASTRRSARTAITETIDELRELDLFDGSVDPDDAIRFSADIPIPADVDVASQPTCSSCGEPLSGDETFCPACGTEITPECPECGVSLSGDENYCPECGAEIAS